MPDAQRPNLNRPPLTVTLSADDAYEVYAALNREACFHNTAAARRKCHELAQRFWVRNDDRFAKGVAK